MKNKFEIIPMNDTEDGKVTVNGVNLMAIGVDSNGKEDCFILPMFSKNHYNNIY